MKTDREMLELAAKAAYYCYDAETETLHKHKHHGWQWNWNPIENDADAFRLAVDLEMIVDVQLGIIFAHAPSLLRFTSELISDDKHAAARRAITRAAAAIGEKK